VVKEGQGDTVPVNLFIPCFIDQCGPRIAEAVVEILGRLGVTWKFPADQTCCGQFAFTLGDLATARSLSRHFLRVFGEAETILCPSASCAYMVRHQYPNLALNERERQEMAALASRVWELSEWLGKSSPLTWTPRFAGSLVLHRSCKAQQLGALPGAATLLAQVAELELKSVSPYYSCCGFGGTFSVQHPELSQALGEAYLAAVKDTGARGLVSLDYSCLLHLSSIAASRGWDLQFLHLAELLTGMPGKEGIRP
jgi:L-lactate dehydrogenase complex protein LldE